MTLDRMKLSAQTVRDNIAILEKVQEPDDAGYYLQLEHEKFVLECIEKQIPKKYIREKTDFFSFPVIKCPNCTGIIGKVEFLENCELVICPRGCPCCGQAIDRSDVE